MSYYFIEKPSVSKGLKRTYCKKLEVFEGEVEIEEVEHKQNKYYQYKILRVTAIYTYGKRGWSKKDTIRFPGSVHRTGRISNVASSADVNATLYTTLEAAQASKLLLIQNMAETYKKELEKLKALFQRNVPNIDTPLTELLEEHPDLFI